MATAADKANELEAMAARVRDLRPAMEAVGVELVRQTLVNFGNERESDGAPFEQLKPATVDARLRKAGALKTTKRGAAKGYLTSGAAKKQERMLAPGGIKILTDTARAKNSVNTKADTAGLTYSIVGYMAGHMAPSGDGTKRNPTPFEMVGGKWSLIPGARAMASRVVGEYIRTGSVRL